MPRAVTVTYDYRCPFAYNGNVSVVASIRAGTDVDYRFQPFSLDQAHVAEGEPPVWERDPADWGTGILSLLFSVAVRGDFPQAFLDAHLAIFAARHEHGLQLQEESVLRDAVTGVGLDPDAVASVAWSDEALATLAKEHTALVDDYQAFGVPTFIEGDEAVFVRFMEKERVDDIERMLELLSWDRLNEFKRTRIRR